MQVNKGIDLRQPIGTVVPHTSTSLVAAVIKVLSHIFFSLSLSFSLFLSLSLSLSLS